MEKYVRNYKPGAVIVGSHVRKTTSQLAKLLKMPGVEGIEVAVDRVSADRDALLQEVQTRVNQAHAEGLTPVIYTSRTEKTFADQASRLQFGESVSAMLMDIVRNLPVDIGFLISKGGITSNDVLSSGLSLRMSRVVGQILPGCSVVLCPDDHPRYPKLPVVIFPGNVGNDDALAIAYSRLSGDEIVQSELKKVNK